MILKVILNRLVATIFVLFAIATTTFLLLRFIPGDPVELMLKDHGSQIEADALRDEMGLDKPFVQQYIKFLTNLTHGDLGTSYLNHEKVADEIGTHLPQTLILAFTSLALAIFLGIPAGVVAAYKVGTVLDKTLSAFTLFSLSIPSFWLAPVLIIIFSIKLNFLPVSGQDDGIKSLVLPAITLAFSLAAVLQRTARASTLEVLNDDYIRVARAKGLPEKIILFKHALKNALTPIITVTGLQVGAIATGVVITETIFDWPGLGILLYSGLRSRNYPIVQGCILTIGFIYVVTNLLTDLAHMIITPNQVDDRVQT